ncbi:MAG: glycosyltransferase [Candidatus Caldatribacterium sp.]|nr:glycosyltransferase [Candidatus Caldatribacterium sp.]
MFSALQTHRRTLPLRLDYLEALTDHFGLYQHATFGVPDLRHGYTTDDVSRALLVVTHYFELSGKVRALRLLRRYLSFLQWAQRDDGLFHNFFGIDRKPDDEVGSEECQGRAFWALSRLFASPLPREFKEPAWRMLERLLPHVASFAHPHSIAFFLEGFAALARATVPSCLSIGEYTRALGEKLLKRYLEHSDSSWKWFDEVLTWGNALLPAALFAASEVTGEKRFLAVAQESFEFLSQQVFRGDIFVPVGNRGWYRKGGNRAIFDQQPIEAFWMLVASLRASKVYNPEENRKRARISLEWFLGRNVHRLSLYDPETGSCADGLTPSGLNENRGAESTVLCLLGLLTAHAEALKKIRIL